ncbi:lytic transglycosylase domain-containing protein [Acinetobacter qingfengensis]|uniref:Transglycosylase n=1 Tax=Acinetobacter qingfengensis TaxID=1262585 RepID=A0A1E7REK1_9GAMM|nr:lytic transglycosylase domain-containing protein [Acinetobacter qingfengensis]KAA8731119.1 lytic transglycosylase domain-containing protein [Acinetobacter qingfengensis]OEY97788.1 transglycosylase [Acinetobacter qingfengensis]
MNNKLTYRASFPFLLTGLLALLNTPAQAGHLYVYKDATGTPLLTDKRQNHAHYKQVKVTYFSDSNVHRYSNWGNSEAAVLPSFSKTKNAYDGIIKAAAQNYGVAEGLIKAVMHTESGFNATARSPVGAQGLMQLMPATARRFNVGNVYDPAQNIHGGARYLSWLIKRFNGNTTLALAAYNAGEGNVTKYGGIPPFKETQDYVRRVLSRYNNLYADGISISSQTQTSTGSNANNPGILETRNIRSASQREIILINGVYTDRIAQ